MKKEKQESDKKELIIGMIWDFSGQAQSNCHIFIVIIHLHVSSEQRSQSVSKSSRAEDIAVQPILTRALNWNSQKTA